MKKIIFVIVSLFISLNVVKAFNVDVDKIDISGLDNNVINNISNVYKIDTESFNNFNNETSDDLKSYVKDIVSISLSDDKDNKLKKLNEHLYIGENGSNILTGNLFISDFVNKINDNNYEYDYIKNIRSVDFYNDKLVFVYLDDININNVISDMVLTYWVINTDSGYKIHYASFTTDKDLEGYFNQLSNNEINNNVINNVNKSFGFTSNEVDNDLMNSIYENNKYSNVSITGLNDAGITSYGSGFYLRSGVVVTSWYVFLSYLNNSDYIYINDCDGKTYSIDGVIAANTLYDVVVLKINKDEGRAINFGNVNDLKSNDNVFMINSIDNNSFSIKNGNYLSNSNGKISNLFAINSSSIGSAIYDSNGNVIGFATGESLNNELSFGNDISYLKELKDILDKMNFNNINYYNIKEFKLNYYSKFSNEKNSNNINSNVWNIYKNIGNIEDNINLELIKGSYKDNIISLRYKNDFEDSIGSMYLINNYIECLEEQGYKLEFNNDNKVIYSNDKYKVIIKSNMNYIIILLMES